MYCDHHLCSVSVTTVEVSSRFLPLPAARSSICDRHFSYVVLFFSQVTYKAEFFIDKNADRLHRDLVSLLANSTNPLAQALFSETPTEEEMARRHPSLSAQFKKQVENTFVFFCVCETLHMKQSSYGAGMQCVAMYVCLHESFLVFFSPTFYFFPMS